MNPPIHTAIDRPQAADDPAQGLEALVVKQGLSLGGLSEAQRDVALAVAWSGLPAHTMSEAAVNQALKAALAGVARCLGTDHVELRRWLCDTGWLQRDAWGREYRRVAVADLPERLRPVAEGLARRFGKQDPAAWVEARRVAREAERRARRQAHEAAAPVAAPDARRASPA